MKITYSTVKLQAATTISDGALAIALTEDPEKIRTLAQSIQNAAKMLEDLCDIELDRCNDIKSMITKIEALL